jgi:hypothetical protein
MRVSGRKAIGIFTAAAVRAVAEQTVSEQSGDGKALPLQSWPLASWPDGSMKFIGFATAVGENAGHEFRLTRGSRAGAGWAVKTGADAIEIDTGKSSPARSRA